MKMLLLFAVTICATALAADASNEDALKKLLQEHNKLSKEILEFQEKTREDTSDGAMRKLISLQEKDMKLVEEIAAMRKASWDKKTHEEKRTATLASCRRLAVDILVDESLGDDLRLQQAKASREKLMRQMVEYGLSKDEVYAGSAEEFKKRIDAVR